MTAEKTANFQSASASSFSWERTVYQINLETKGCCFVCLRRTQFKTEEGQEPLISNKQESLKNLCRHLKIDLQNLVNSLKVESNFLMGSTTGNINPSLGKTEIKVSVCETCGKITETFSKLFLQLEIIQMEINLCLEEINQRISETYCENSELAQNYSQLMTSDEVSLKFLAFTDGLRKEIKNKCLTERFNGQARVELERIILDQRVTEKGNVSPPNSAISPTLNQPLLSIEEIKTEQLSPSPPQQQSTIQVPLPAPIAAVDETSATTTLDPKPEVERDNQSTGSNSNPRSNKAKLKSSLKLQKKESYYAKNSSKEKKTFDCTSCSKTFATPGTRTIHYEAVHLKKRYNCTICNIASFSHHSNFQKHRKICETTLPKRLAKISERKKDPKYKFKCSKCHETFGEPNHLRDHLNSVHFKVQKYACDLCGKKFCKQFNLDDHKDGVHLGTIYTCEHCKKTCRGRVAYRNHAKNCGSNKTEKGNGANSEEKVSKFTEEVRKVQREESTESKPELLGVTYVKMELDNT